MPDGAIENTSKELIIIVSRITRLALNNVTKGIIINRKGTRLMILS